MEALDAGLCKKANEAKYEENKHGVRSSLYDDEWRYRK